MVDVEVFWCPVRPAQALLGFLDDHERAKAARRSAPDLYVTAHALQRRTIGARLGIDPRALTFERSCRSCESTSHGKPRVSGHASLFTSLSYAGGLAVVALTRGGEVGVDVEDVVESDFPGFAAANLAPEETAAMAALEPDPARLRPARARIWARKEAVLKATGHGLAIDPREVVVSGPEAPAALVGWRGELRPADPVRLLDVVIGDPGHEVALAVLTTATVTVQVSPLPL